MKYTYPAEKFSTARTNLMLPHTQGEAASIAAAFHECSLGLMDLREPGLTNCDLNDEAKTLIRELRGLMDTTGLVDPDGVGLNVVKARTLTDDEKRRLSHIVDELNFWFRNPE